VPGGRRPSLFPARRRALPRTKRVGFDRCRRGRALAELGIDLGRPARCCALLRRVRSRGVLRRRDRPTARSRCAAPFAFVVRTRVRARRTNRRGGARVQTGTRGGAAQCRDRRERRRRRDGRGRRAVRIGHDPAASVVPHGWSRRDRRSGLSHHRPGAGARAMGTAGASSRPNRSRRPHRSRARMSRRGTSCGRARTRGAPGRVGSTTSRR